VAGQPQADWLLAWVSVHRIKGGTA